MFLVQKTILLTLPNQEVVRYDDPKIQPFFAKMAGLAKVKPKMTGYQNFELKVDGFNSKNSFIDTIRQTAGQI